MAVNCKKKNSKSSIAANRINLSTKSEKNKRMRLFFILFVCCIAVISILLVGIFITKNSRKELVIQDEYSNAQKCEIEFISNVHRISGIINYFSKGNTCYAPIKNSEDSDINGCDFQYKIPYNVYGNKNYMMMLRYSGSSPKMQKNNNNEDLFAYYMDCGTTFYYVKGDEYADVLPIYDWNKIPGTTTRQSFFPKLIYLDESNTPRNKSKTIDISKGKVGASYIALNRNGVKSKQGYFMFPQGVVCLGADISSAKSEEIVTAINQARLLSDVVFSVNGEKTKFKEMNKIATYDFVYHNGISYISDSPMRVKAEKNVKGDWKDINHRRDSKPVENDLFTIYLSHGVRPKKSSYDYTVLMNTTPLKTEEYLKAPSLITLNNDKNIQAVYDKENSILQAIFHRGGEVELPDGTTLSVDKGCVCIFEMVDGKYLLSIISDNFKDKNISAAVNGIIKDVEISKETTTVEF